MTKVLLLCEYATLNGGERSLLSVVGGLAEAGFRLSAAVPPNGPLADELHGSGIEVVPLELYDNSGRRRSQADVRRQIGDIVKQRRPALLHANSVSMSRLVGPAAKELPVASIGHLRDIIKISRQAISDLNCHTRLLAVSQATRKYHVAAGLDAAKTHVLHNGVDLDLFRPRRPSSDLHKALGLPPSAMLIGAIGQIGMRKGLDVLLAAASQVVQRVPQAHFVLVGTRHSQKDEAVSFEAALRSLASKPPLAGHVHFLGERGDVPQLLSEFTVLAHAARQEPLGRVLLEAAASGRPVVATDVGGTREIFPDASTACLVPPDDLEGLAAGLVSLLADADKRQQMGEAARHRAEQAFDRNYAARQLAIHYKAVLTLPAGGCD